MTKYDHAYTEHSGPQGSRTRGTVLIVPGRGETHGTYRRLGARLAADAYRVRVIDAPQFADDVERTLDEVAGRISDALPADPEGVVRPLVLIGSDAGAVAISALAARGEQSAAWWPQGVVLAGLPGYGEHQIGDWEQ